MVTNIVKYEQCNISFYAGGDVQCAFVDADGQEPNIGPAIGAVGLEARQSPFSWLFLLHLGDVLVFTTDEKKQSLEAKTLYRLKRKPSW